MSLHQLAQQVQSKGRGEDTQLIHMTPGEVQGLQSLAMKHGGSLTINPQTGLPEAGFLSSLLPTILGLGLAPFTGGLSAAMLVGGGYTLATGSLKKGLMAGLGAYGGAGLGSSLSSLGAGAAGAAGSAVTPIAGAAAPTMAPTLGGSVMGGAAGTTSAALNPATLGSGFMNTAPNIAASPLAAAAAPSQLTAASQALQIPTSVPTSYANMGQGIKSLNSLDALKTFGKDNMMNIGMAAAPMLTAENKLKAPEVNQGMIRPYTLERTQNPEAYAQSTDAQGRTNTPVYGQPFDSSERMFFNNQYTAGTPYKAPGPEYKATGGLTALAAGGSIEQMAAQNALGANAMYPQSQIDTPMYNNPAMQRPMANDVVSPSGDVAVDPYTGEQKFAAGGVSDLGGYSDGGRLLRGPGDGVSDDIPAQIGDKQPARLADGEFVIPARIVSELGNGSTEAGARQLYKMMERVQSNRRKTVGKNNTAVDSKSSKLLPA